MNETPAEYHAYTLRGIAKSIALRTSLEIARQPGVRAVYRLTVHYDDAHARDSVGTLCRSTSEAVLEVVYQGAFQHKPLVHPIDLSRYDSFARALQHVHFDQLKDQSNLPPYGVDLWMIERAAGAFSKSVIVAPTLATGIYADLVNAARAYLPEGLREVPYE